MNSYRSARHTICIIVLDKTAITRFLLCGLVKAISDLISTAKLIETASKLIKRFGLIKTIIDVVQRI